MVPYSRIIGTGSSLPAQTVSNEELSQRLSVSAEGIYRRTGIRSRHWAAEGQSSGDFAVEAGRRALEAAGIAPSSVDVVLVSTTSPDMVFPSTACQVQDQLGLRRVAAFDVSASCSGFLYGLSMGNVLLRSGKAGRCLVVAAEVKSRFVDHSDLSTAILFGDGAGAAVLVREEGWERNGVVGIRLYADGAHHALLRMPAGGSRRPTSTETVQEGLHVLHMQGGPLFRVAVKRVVAAMTDLLAEFKVGLDELKHVICHQANGRLLAAIARRMRLRPEQTYSIIEQCGNTSSASLPMALDAAVRGGRIQSGDRVLLGAFGGGMTWATGLLRW